ncbi:MAG TPA: glycoside hydrolase family 38 C-terminal domain-containing protein [bacterium]|nr:glycoside hydrolase family 38 C-terminal domain-containing protein [bacterium]
MIPTIEAALSFLGKSLFGALIVMAFTTIALAEEPKSANRTFHIMPHSHIDVEWYWSYATTRSWTREIMDSAMKLFKESPEFRFTQDQVYLIRDYWNSCSDEEKALFRTMLEQNRLALVGGLLVMPEVAEPCGEALIRQILVGQQWLNETFGVRSRCGWFIDTFGQIPQMPQILARSGYEYNFFWRDIPIERDFAAMPTNFYWRSPDGSEILTHWLAGGYDFSSKQLEINLAHQSSGHVLVPFGSDVARLPEKFDTIKEKTKELLTPYGLADAEMHVVTATEYMNLIAASAQDLPRLDWDFNPPYRAADLRGTFDNRIELKKRNRAAEAWMFNAEVIATLASLNGSTYPAETMQHLWERLLFTHFHDIIGGSHHDTVYENAMAEQQAVLKQSRAIACNFWQADKTGYLTILNTLSFPRTELCSVPAAELGLPASSSFALQDEQGVLHPLRLMTETDDEEGPAWVWLAQNLPPLSAVCYRIVPAPERKPSLKTNRLENEFFSIKWDPVTGDLISIYDKKLDHELLRGPGNAVIAMQEENPDLEGPLYLTGVEKSTAEYAAASIVCTQDALGTALSVISPFQDCRLQREVRLYHHLPRIDFATCLEDFSGGDVMIKVSFPLTLQADKIERTYETPFAATPRPEGHYAAQTWVDCSDGLHGVALLNKGTPGYWLQGARLEMALLRAFRNYTYYQKAGLRKKVPGYESSTQTQLAAEHGTHRFFYSLKSHAGGWEKADLFSSGQSFNVPLVARPGRKTTKPFLSFSPGFIMTALKPALTGKGVIVRGFETTGRRHSVELHLPAHVRKVHKTDLLERPIEQLHPQNGRIRCECAPHEIATFLLE